MCRCWPLVVNVFVDRPIKLIVNKPRRIRGHRGHERGCSIEMTTVPVPYFSVCTQFKVRKSLSMSFYQTKHTEISDFQIYQSRWPQLITFNLVFSQSTGSFSLSFCSCNFTFLLIYFQHKNRKLCRLLHWTLLTCKFITNVIYHRQILTILHL